MAVLMKKKAWNEILTTYSCSTQRRRLCSPWGMVINFKNR